MNLSKTFFNTTVGAVLLATASAQTCFAQTPILSEGQEDCIANALDKIYEHSPNKFSNKLKENDGSILFEDGTVGEALLPAVRYGWGQIFTNGINMAITTSLFQGTDSVTASTKLDLTGEFEKQQKIFGEQATSQDVVDTATDIHSKLVAKVEWCLSPQS
jgi:superfamily II RNA helicase